MYGSYLSRESSRLLVKYTTKLNCLSILYLMESLPEHEHILALKMVIQIAIASKCDLKNLFTNCPASFGQIISNSL